MAQQFSDRELDLEPRWFTGQQWANGTAQKECVREFKEKVAAKNPKQPTKPKKDRDTEPDWSGTCEICGSSPIVPATGMCGPCTFGEADTAGGNW